jgi:hypothetical protein
MRYPASEKLEIIRLVERSDLPARRTLETLGILPFYRWSDRYQTGGPAALADRPSTPRQVWNRIPDEVRMSIGVQNFACRMTFEAPPAAEGDHGLSTACRRRAKRWPWGYYIAISITYEFVVLFRMARQQNQAHLDV